MPELCRGEALGRSRDAGALGIRGLLLTLRGEETWEKELRASLKVVPGHRGDVMPLGII